LFLYDICVVINGSRYYVLALANYRDVNERPF